MKFDMYIAASLAAICALGCAAHAAVKPTAWELNEAKNWTSAKFDAKAPKNEVKSGFIVLANNDPVQRNSRDKQPLIIAGKEYTRGLYCHAVSKIVVQLPQGGKRFTSVIGVDGRSGSGSVIFSVDVNNNEAYSSGVMRNNESKDVDIDLNGATQFVLNIGDGGDGIPNDQANWGDAKVELNNGETIWVGVMQEIGTELKPYTTDLPFSFVYDGKKSSDFINSWTKKTSSKKLDENRNETTITYTDPATKLEVKCVAVSYNNYPTVEWTVYFTNKGSKDTPTLENINAIDTDFSRAGGRPFELHSDIGTNVRADDFAPVVTSIPSGESVRLASRNGRACGGVSPYFDLNVDGRGFLVVVGWPGQWFAQYKADASNSINITAGQEFFAASLKPNETVRTPLMLIQFYEGDYIRSQNIWRRFFNAYVTPQVDGKPAVPELHACSSHQLGEMINANTANQIQFIDGYLDNNLNIDFWWMDAGWYPCKNSWPETGTWEVDKTRFPNGLREISDHAHNRGIKTIVWFEPERVGGDNWITQNHPEWVLSHSLVNIGDPECLAWAQKHFSKMIKDEGIDLYRQDYNIDPLPGWRSGDTEGRVGVVENMYVQGYLAFWDYLLADNPGLRIDSCASGGHRNDLETMRRAVPLLRSDYIFEPVGQQNHTYGMSFWIPWQGTGIRTESIYDMRSAMVSGQTACWDVRDPNINYDMFRKYISEWREVSPNFFGDYYPLTPYDKSNSCWMAMQFDTPETGKGVIQAYRRASSSFVTADFKLQGLDENADYIVRDMDLGSYGRISGKELSEKGVRVTLEQPSSAAIITYEKVN